ncbi:MAG: nucleoside triphosphate pyrophosphatase [Gemmatimonadota bacterium]
MTKLILASTSPRRKLLLEMLGIEFEVRPPHIAEFLGPDEDPRRFALRLSREKALAVPGDLVLGADTTVLLGSQLLEKPVDAADALVILRRLQGQTHEVITSIAVVSGGVVRQATDITRVVFRPCDDDYLRAYIATGEPMDKAGAYGIQGYGAALVERIDGDFFGVMGLPVRLVLRLLGEAGYPYRFGGGQ